MVLRGGFGCSQDAARGDRGGVRDVFQMKDLPTKEEKRSRGSALPREGCISSM